MPEMSQPVRYEVSAEMAARAHINQAAYQALYRRSHRRPERFLGGAGPAVCNLVAALDAGIRLGLSGARNPLVRGRAAQRRLQLPGSPSGEPREESTAILWEADEPGDQDRELPRAVRCRVPLRQSFEGAGCGQGGPGRECTCPWFPRPRSRCWPVPGIGAVHSVVFGGFSPESLKDRILDSDCRVVVTTDEGLRGGRHVPLKANVDAALLACPRVHTVFVLRRTGR